MPHIPQPEIHKLSNGIPVIFQNYDGAVSSIYWWIKTGSADELPKEAGFAHFLEHMHFKDTDAKSSGRASTGQLARAIEGFGGDVNAYTSFDQTVYHVTCAAHHWERVLDVFGEMAKPQKFLKEDFNREREVILEELRKNEDSPGRMVFQNLFSNTYSKHPYGRPVIGYVKTLKAATVKDLEAFYKRQYVSGNMGIVMVGPFDVTRKQKLVTLLEKRFGKKVIPEKKPYIQKRKFDDELRAEPKFSVLPFDVTTPSICFSFRVPDLKHEDVAALDLASAILSMGEMGRLYQSLFYEKSLVTDVGGSLYIPKDPGILYFNADVTDGSKIEPAYQEILNQISRLRDHGPTTEELERVLANAESERFYSQQTADGVAGRLGFLMYQMGDLSHDQHYLEELKTVDQFQIQEVLKKYFDPRRLSVTVMVPKKDKDYSVAGLKKITTETLSKPKIKESVKKPVVHSELPQKIVLPSGATVLYRYRPQSHVMSVHAATLGGLRLELTDPVVSAEHDQGASYLLASTWNKGTQNLSAREISKQVEGMAAGLDGFSGRNTIGLQCTGLAHDWPKLSQLFNDVLLRPLFSKDELEHAKRVAEDSIKSIEDHSSSLCSKLFLETLYEHHPYGKYYAGTLESIRGLNTETLQAFHKKWVRPERLIISVVGNIWRKSLDSWIESLDDELSRLKSKDLISQIQVPEEPEAKGPRWVEKNLGREQVHLMVGNLGLKMTDSDRMAMRILQTILGGQSGRLFIELREKKSMAYTVAPINIEGIERGYIGTYMACAHAKKDEAIKGMQKVLEDLAKKGPTTAEMKRASQYYLGRRAMDMQGDSSLSSYYGLEEVYGLKLKTDQEWVHAIESVTPKQVQEVCRKYYVEPHKVTAAVG